MATATAVAVAVSSLGPRRAPSKVRRHRAENLPWRIGVSTKRYDNSVTIAVSTSANVNSDNVNLLPATSRIIW